MSKPDDPAGFVSQFGSDFKLGKNPFHIVKPDGTSDLTPKQQQEAAAIFSNVFDGESYYNYKLQEAVKNIASRFGAKSAKPSNTKPQSAWDEIETTRDEQLERRKQEREEKAAFAALDNELPMAMRRADEADEQRIDTEEFDSRVSPEMQAKQERMFYESYGFKPSESMLNNPVYLYTLRTKNGDESFSKQQLKKSQVMMDFPRVVDNTTGAEYFGGDQLWYGDHSIEYYAGCPSVAATNIIFTMASRNPALAKKMGVNISHGNEVSYEDYKEVMDKAYETIGSYEAPILRELYEGGKFTPVTGGAIQPSYGMFGDEFVERTLELAKSYGVELKSKTMMTGYSPKYHEPLEFINEGLDKGYPVNLFASVNEVSLYHYDESKGAPLKTFDQDIPFHHMVVVGTYSDSDGDMLIVSTWGRMEVVEYRELFYSWQDCDSVISSLTYFAPADETQDKRRD